MDISVRKIDLTDLNERDAAGIHCVIESSETATIFHTPEWNRILMEYFHMPCTLLVASQDHRIVGLHILYRYGDHTYRSPAIERQSVYGGPVAMNDDPTIVQMLLKESERVCPLAYFQIWSPPYIAPETFVGMGYASEEMFTPIMKLDDSVEAQWSRLHRDKRYKIRKAKSAGLEVNLAGLEEVQDYHAMVSETLGRANLTALPLGFLQKVMSVFGPQGRANLFLVRLGREIISGTIVLYHKKTMYGWDIGWRREFANLSPNDLLTWEVAQHASQNGYRRFDLLRIEPDRLPGIARWKETFGGEIVPCYLFRKETPAYRLVRPVSVALNHPERVIQKLRLWIGKPS